MPIEIKGSKIRISGGVKIIGNVRVGGRIVDGDLVTQNGQEVTGEVAEQIKAQALKQAEEARTMADRLRQQAQETVKGAGATGAVSAEAPQTILSGDLVGRGLTQDGAKYRFTGRTDSATGKFIYEKVS